MTVVALLSRTVATSLAVVQAHVGSLAGRKSVWCGENKVHGRRGK